MMKLVNVNKGNEGLLVIGCKLVEKKNGNEAVIVKAGIDGKYGVVVNNEEKVYSVSTLQRNWSIVIEEEVISEVALDMERVLALPAPVMISNEEAVIENEVMIDSNDVYIFDSRAEKIGKVNVTGHIYGVPVKADNINQTTMWKVLMELYKNRDDENDIYPIEQKVLCIKTLKAIDEETFEGAYRCLVSKTKKNYIDTLMK